MRKLDTEIINEAKRRYLNGDGVKVVANALGRDYSTIFKYLKDDGLTRPNRISQEKIPQIIHKYVNEHKPAMVVAQEMNLNYLTVRKYLNRNIEMRGHPEANHIWWKRRRNALRGERLQEEKIISDYYKQEYAPSKIGKLMGCSSAKVWEIVKRLGIARSSGEAGRIQWRARRLDLDIDAIVESYNSGISTNKIARELGVSQQAIQKRLREVNVLKNREETYKSPHRLRNLMRAVCASPNKPEQYLASLLGILWKYTGSGELIIGGKCPDFWDGDKRLMELYGDYWHRGENPQDRIDYFKEYGYDCAVIWESELYDDDIMEKLGRCFT